MLYFSTILYIWMNIFSDIQEKVLDQRKRKKNENPYTKTQQSSVPFQFPRRATRKKKPRPQMYSYLCKIQLRMCLLHLRTTLKCK